MYKTASRLDKHQHTGMYTAQLYAAVCDCRDCRTSHVRQSRIVKNHDFGKNRDFRDFFEIFEKNAFFRLRGPPRAGGVGYFPEK